MVTRQTEKFYVRIWTIEWMYGGYKAPPEGYPNVLFQFAHLSPWGEGARTPPEVENLLKEHPKPRGYMLSTRSLRAEERRTLSPEQRGQIRRKNLRRRLEQKMPLFADELESRELDGRPEYFEGKRPQVQEEFIQQEAEKDRQAWEAAMQNLGMVIYHQWW